MMMSDSIPLVIDVEQAPAAEAAIAEQTLSLNDPPGQLAQRAPIHHHLPIIDIRWRLERYRILYHSLQSSGSR